jgi:hypothetical protein
MHKRGKWFFLLLVGVWVLGCSHSPGPATKVAQPTAAPVPAAVASTQGVPVAVVAESDFNFGKVSESGEYVHDFKVANKGDGILEIKKVLPA